MLRRPPTSTLFPYTTLFRSLRHRAALPRLGSDFRAAQVLPGAGRDDSLPLLHAASSWKRSEEHTSELQSRGHLVCRLLLEKKNNKGPQYFAISRCLQSQQEV